MDFWSYTTLRDACKRSGAIETADDFYQTAFTDAVKMGSGQEWHLNFLNSLQGKLI